MNKFVEIKKFLNRFDYFLIPVVFAIAFVALFKGVFSQVDFFSDLLTNKEVLQKNECFEKFYDDFCQLWGTSEEFDYSYEYRLPGLAFLFGDYPNIEDVNVGVFMFECAIIAYVYYRVNKFRNFKRQKNL